MSVYNDASINKEAYFLVNNPKDFRIVRLEDFIERYRSDPDFTKTLDYLYGRHVLGYDISGSPRITTTFTSDTFNEFSVEALLKTSGTNQGSIGAHTIELTNPKHNRGWWLDSGDTPGHLKVDYTVLPDGKSRVITHIGIDPI